jgi:hypothetical protein
MVFDIGSELPPLKSRFTKWTTTFDEIQQMALSSSAIKSSASNSPPRAARDESAQLSNEVVHNSAISSAIISNFRVLFKMAALDRLTQPVIAQIIESWILVELGKNGGSIEPLRMAQLFKKKNVNRAERRYVEIEFWDHELRTQFALNAFILSLTQVRKTAGEVGTTLDTYKEMSVEFIREDIAHASNIGRTEPSTLSPPPSLFKEIVAGIQTGLWKMENGWEPKIQIIFDLFHSQLTASIITLASAKDLAPPFIYFIKTFPYPHHLINYLSPAEAADPSFVFAKLSETEYKNQIEIFGRYCAEGGHQRARKQFVEKEMEYDVWNGGYKNVMLRKMTSPPGSKWRIRFSYTILCVTILLYLCWSILDWVVFE